MKATTLALIVLWPLTIYLLLRALATCYVAYEYSRSKQLQLLNQVRQFSTGLRTVYPWRRSILYAVISLLLLTYFQGWLILS